MPDASHVPLSAGSLTGLSHGLSCNLWRRPTAALLVISLAVSALVISLSADDGEGVLSKQWPWLWHLRWLPSSFQQWTAGAVGTGCLLNTVVVLGLLHIAFAGGGSFEGAQPRRAHVHWLTEPPSRDSPKGDFPVGLEVQDQGLGWPSLWQCGCWSRGPAERAETKEAALLQDSKDFPPVARSEIWLHSKLHIHPKFCGLRLQEPTGQLPSLARFQYEKRHAAAVPEEWRRLLRCTDEERRLCGELKARIAEVDGVKDPVTMLRFLRARQRDVPRAAAMYRASATWKEENGLERGFREGTLDDALHRRVDAHWPPTAILGEDREGDPVYWNRLGTAPLDFLSEVPVSFLGQHEVYSIVRVLQAMEEHGRRVGRPVMYMTVIVDLADMGPRWLKNLHVLHKMKVCARILEDHYPEMVKRIVVINAPRIAFTMYKVVSQFFDEGTRNKLQIASRGNTFETLSKFVDVKWIPEALGGSHCVGTSPYCEPIIPVPSVPFPSDLLESVKSFP